MKEKHKQEQPRVPCSNCDGTGKTRKGSAAAGEGETPSSYGGEVCPVCGGSGKVPAPTIDASKEQKNCFVATVAFGDPDCEELTLLRRFRDERLSRRGWGRAFTRTYYRVGPGLAAFVARRPWLKARVKRGLSAFCERLRRG